MKAKVQVFLKPGVLEAYQEVARRLGILPEGSVVDIRESQVAP